MILRIIHINIYQTTNKQRLSLEVNDETLKLEEQNSGDSRMLTVWIIENTKTEVHHLILLILNGFDTVRMFTVISVMSETNICETPINKNAHPEYHPLADPKTLVQTDMHNTEESIHGNVLQHRTDEWKMRKTVVKLSSSKWYNTHAFDTLKGDYAQLCHK